VTNSHFVKICGVTTADDAKHITTLDTSAIGIVFAASARKIGIEQAKAIISVVPENFIVVGVFKDQTDDEILTLVDETGISGVQIHGPISDQLLAHLRERDLFVIQALAPNDLADPAAVDAYLLDGDAPGSGETPARRYVKPLPATTPIIVAGGLGPNNVSSVIASSMPWGVDCASGTESSPGKKDKTLVEAFVANARISFKECE
jgi:phosphoribosylanthranilate isomerase